jgi:hypothetical protein
MQWIRHRVLNCGKVPESSQRSPENILICRGSGCSQTLPASTTAAQMGALLMELENCNKVQHAECKALVHLPENEEKGTKFCGCCCSGHFVSFQFLRANEQEESSAFHKLVGDLVDPHRLLSLFIVVSPVL